MRGLAALILVSAFTACTTARIDVARHSTASIDADLGVVILARQHDGGQDTEESFMDCVTGALSDGEAPISLYPEQDFVDALFPWFEPRIAPTTPEALPALLNRPGVGEKDLTDGIDYFQELVRHLMQTASVHKQWTEFVGGGEIFFIH